MRTVNGSVEPEMSLTHSCGEVIKYYLSDVMNTDIDLLPRLKPWDSNAICAVSASTYYK